MVVHKILHMTEDATQVETSLTCGKEEIRIECVKEKEDGSETEISTISGNEIQVYLHRNDEEGEDCDMRNILMLMDTNLMAVTAVNPKG